MISYAQALELVERKAVERPLSVESVPTERALGRLLARDLSSPEDVPSFDNSAMDGFAIRAEWATQANPTQPVVLPVLGCLFAGDSPVSSATRGAWEIMTGAPMPLGAYDTVIRLEDVVVERDGEGKAIRLRIARPPRAGDHVRARGEDFRVGQTLLTDRVRIGPEQLLALSSLGVSEVPVLRKIRVAVISTGKELVEASAKALEPGKIRNSTAPFLLAALERLGVEATYCGVIADEIAQFQKAFLQALAESPDLILTTGAVSMGQHDFMGVALTELLGARLVFHKVAIRPGKPLLFAELPGRDTVVFGLPGNPVSTSVGLRFFVEPYLNALQRLPAEKSTSATLIQGFRKPEGLRCFFKARVEADATGVRAEALPAQASFMVSPLLQANAWVIIPEEGASIEPGAEVQVVPLHPASHGWGGG